MKLMILSNNPTRASFRQRIGVYLEDLNKSGIDTHVHKLPRNYLERWRLFKTATDFDTVLIHKKCLNRLDLRSHYRLFQRTMNNCDLVIAGNDYLASHARKYNRNVVIIPTGLDTSGFTIETTTREDDIIRLVWIGSKSTLKYLEALKESLEQIGKKYSNVVLRIICDAFFELGNMKTEKCIWSLQKQKPLLASSDIGLAPLPDNNFTRGKCGFKILQYQSERLPVVTSPVGVNTDFVENNINGFHATTKKQWIEALEKLIVDKHLREKMGNKAYQHATQFDLSIISKKLINVISENIES